MMTPRGFSVEKTRALEKQQGLEGCEQLSPVSVLNKSIFEEECSPSPTVTVVIEGILLRRLKYLINKCYMSVSSVH